MIRMFNASVIGDPGPLNWPLCSLTSHTHIQLDTHIHVTIHITVFAAYWTDSGSVATYIDEQRTSCLVAL